MPRKAPSSCSFGQIDFFFQDLEQPSGLIGECETEVTGIPAKWGHQFGKLFLELHKIKGERTRATARASRVTDSQGYSHLLGIESN